MFLSEKVLMVEPRGFNFNVETSADNFFQSANSPKAPGEAAMKEFHELKNKIMKTGITVTVISPNDGIITPDGVFPNNWFSTTPGGELILYPMMAVNRRNERRKEIINRVNKEYKTLIDLSPLENKNAFLEGTGSLVIDHENKIAYASLSKRTSKEALEEWCRVTNYEPVTFTSYDQNNEIIYHTNVVLTLGDGFCIVCLDAIKDDDERDLLRKKLGEKNELIIINHAQLKSYCGNCLQLKNHNGEKFLIMSAKAYQAFSEQQKCRLIRYTNIIYSGLSTIESIGGGSARCMIAELF
jgi:hypothetical protein